MSDSVPSRFKEYLPYSRPSLDKSDIDAVTSVLTGSVISQGAVQDQLEQSFTELTGAPYAVAFSTGSSAIHGMCFAAGIGPGDEVIVPALTFAGTSNAILHLGATPVFADIVPDTFCLDPGHVDDLVSPKTKAVLTVDFAGRPCDYRALRAVTDKNGLMLLADAAHSAGATYQSQTVGSIADMTAFSLNPIKNITAGEGGLVTGIVPGAEDKLRQFRAHGMTREPGLLLSDAPAGWYYEQQYLGFNYKLSELHAALGLSQLTRLESHNQYRRDLADVYSEELGDTPLDLPAPYDDGLHAWHLYVIRVQGASVDRNRVFEELRRRNVGVQLHYIPVPVHPYYAQNGYSMDGLPKTADYFERAFSLPLHPNVTSEAQQTVVAWLRELV